MKYMFLIVLVAFSAQEVFMCFAGPAPGLEVGAEPVPVPGSEPCFGRLCVAEYKPVCGKQKVGDCWVVKIFNSSCLMDSENDCGKANYIPCVEDECLKPSDQY